MTQKLKIVVGQYSDKGLKKINQDFHGLYIPDEPLLSSKGIAIAIADGISSSTVSQVASEAAVTGFLEDYYCTPESWTVRKSVQRVLLATNSWLYSQTGQSQFRFNKEKGYVCTFSALVLKSTTAYLFHVGDSRIYRVESDRLVQLTDDHRTWISKEDSYLSGALGVRRQLEVDHQCFTLEQGEVFMMATDGVYEFIDERFVIATIKDYANDLDQAAQLIVAAALQKGSQDNLTVQIIRVKHLPFKNVEEVYQQLTHLPFPPMLEARMKFDGYHIIREINGSNRSHVYLAIDTETQTEVIIKIPSVDLSNDAAYLERFLMEEWVARRINNPHVLKPCQPMRQKNYIYSVMEYIEGQTLSQWMLDHPVPDIETVRDIVEQVAKGLRAFHRLQMLHQDLRPDNIMIDRTGTVKLIDFGAVRVEGVMEMNSPLQRFEVLGTTQYAAPEYFIGEPGTTRSDLFSLGVLAYQMLSGQLPYGTEVAKAHNKVAQRKLNYHSLLNGKINIPYWVDDTIKKAVHPEPLRRYQQLSEFLYDLRYPNPKFIYQSRPPLLERNPVTFWKGLSLVLVVIILMMLIQQNT